MDMRYKTYELVLPGTANKSELRRSLNCLRVNNDCGETQCEFREQQEAIDAAMIYTSKHPGVKCRVQELEHYRAFSSAGDIVWEN